ncbi:hypothetical protein HMPREF1549_03037 [Actinomyces johnsonii F0510]|uniref:Uncharacterized protein n=1 Tax=Actinomyces johnsonii F0510 TaxID=1227262 RepID=U1PGU7_9ACTO|nr:hypothetical protein HMPREF1549_03037 [Actinomyces johnsonii F0510]
MSRIRGIKGTKSHNKARTHGHLIVLSQQAPGPRGCSRLLR